MEINNWGMIGHEWAVQILRQHVSQDNLRHAYLLTGPQGVGRRTLALRFAQAINCLQTNIEGDPCGSCRACQQIEKMQYPDLSIVQAEQMSGTLKVDQVRELQHSLALAPYEARHRVAILLRFEEAHPSAANALLKTLEEPPGQTILLLTASDSESLLPTINSRCEILRLRPVSFEQTAQGLQQYWQVPSDQSQLLAHISGGRPGYALRLYQQPELLEERLKWLDTLQEILPANRGERFAVIDSLTKNRDSAKENVRQMLNTWLPLWRDVMLFSAGSTAPILNPDQDNLIQAIVAAIDLTTAQQCLARIEHTLTILEHNANTRLAAEVLMLNMPRISIEN